MLNYSFTDEFKKKKLNAGKFSCIAMNKARGVSGGTILTFTDDDDMLRLRVKLLGDPVVISVTDRKGNAIESQMTGSPFLATDALGGLLTDACVKAYSDYMGSRTFMAKSVHMVLRSGVVVDVRVH